MPETPTKVTIALSAIALLLTAAGLWVSFSDYLRKGNDARPVLDITDIRVIRRFGVTFTDYQPTGEQVQLSITYRNSGAVEAANIVVMDTAWDRALDLARSGGQPLPSIHRPDMAPGAVQTIETVDDALKGPSDLIRVMFRGRISYTNRLNGHKYSEPWCFYTSAFELMKNLPGDGFNTELSIPLVACPVH